MPHYFFIRTPEAIDHLADHDVTPAEFEEIVCRPEHEDVSRSTGNLLAFGYSSDGRYLCCVFRMLDDETIEPVTAYEVGN